MRNLLHTLRPEAAEEAELETAGDEPGESTAAAAAAALEALELQSAMRRVPGRAGLAVADAHTGLTAAFAAPKSHMAQFVVAQERHADQLEAVADQHAAETKAATAAAKEARDAAQRLQHALEAMGFAPKWARAALRVTGREEAAADERSRRSAALDWLCLHVPLDQMPALLMRSEGMRAVAAGDDDGGGSDGSGDDEYVRLVKAVITRRLGLLLGFAPNEVQPVLLACAYDEDAALHTLLRSLQPADSADGEGSGDATTTADDGDDWVAEREEEREALLAIFGEGDDGFEHVSDSVWRVAVPLGQSAVATRLGPCHLQVVLPPDCRYPAEAPLLLLRNATLAPRSRRAVNGALAAYAASLRGTGPLTHTLVLWLQQYLPSIAAHFLQMDAEEEEEELEDEGEVTERQYEAEYQPEVGHLGRTYMRTDERAATEAMEEERRRQRIELLRSLLDGTAAAPPAVEAEAKRPKRVPPPRPKPVFTDRPYVSPEPTQPLDPAATLAARKEAFEAKRSQAVEQAQTQLHARLMKEQRRRESQPPPAAAARPPPPPPQPQQPSGSVLGKAPPPPGPKPAASWLAKHLALPIPAAKPSKPAATPAAAGEKSVAAPQLVAPSVPTPSHAPPPPAAAAAATAEPSAVETQLAQLDAAAKLAREAKESARLLAAHRQRQAKPAYQAMQEVRATLPAFSLRDSIVEAVREHQVTVVSGATGCGKTTQIPQLLLDDALERGVGGTTSIICTQPRRISATAVAERVAAERAVLVGDEVGYSIRMEAKSSRDTRMLFCTTGILLRRLQSDPLLQGVSHVLVDEVHERDLNSDFLLIVLRDLLPRRKDLRIVAMSATVNADLFANYFSHVTGGCPVVEIPGRTFPVEEYRLEDAIEATGYVCEPESPFAWGGAPGGRSGGRGSGRGGGARGDKGGGGGRGGGTRAASAAAAIQDSMFFGSGSEIDPKMRELYPGYAESTLKCLQTVNEEVINYELVELLIRHIADEYDDGAILVFLPGMAEIRTLNEMLSSSLVEKQNDFLLIPLHSTLTSEEQRRTFSTPPPGVRKVVMATNIAETSITIDDVVFVIDCGRVKEMRYDGARRMASLETVWVSRASARQRRGRAGRVKPGYCFHMFSSKQEALLEDFTQAEIMRVPLDQLCLQIKALQLGDVAAFLQRAIEPPSATAIKAAVDALHELAAVDAVGELTPLGQHLAELPVDARLGKMILYGAIFGCADPILTIAAAMSHRSPFAAPIDKRDQADAARRALAAPAKPNDCTPTSDHLVLLRAYNGWQAAKSRGAREERAFLTRYFLSASTLKGMADLKRQFAELLSEKGFVRTGLYARSMERLRNKGDGVSAAIGADANRNAECLPLVRAVVAAGLYPNIARIDSRAGFLTSAAQSNAANAHGSHQVVQTRLDGDVAVHPSSINFNCGHFAHPFLLFHEKVLSSKIYLRETTMVGGYALLLFAGSIAVDHDRAIITVDGWIDFNAPVRAAVLFKELRTELDKMLIRKIEQPGLPVAAGGTDVAAQVVAGIVELLRAEDEDATPPPAAAAEEDQTPPDD